MSAPKPTPASRTNVRFEPEVLDRLKRWAYWERLKLQHVIEEAAIDALTAAEVAHGGPWPPLPNGMTHLPAGPPLRQPQGQ